MAKNSVETNGADTVSASKAQKFSIEKLRKHCLELFGITVSAFDGATSGMTGEYSVEEIKTKLKNWNKQEVG